MNRMHWHRNHRNRSFVQGLRKLLMRWLYILGVALAIWSVFLQTTPLALSQEAISIRKQELIKSYVAAAFAYGRRTRLLKFKSDGIVSVSFQCLSGPVDACKNTVSDALELMLDTNNFKRSSEPNAEFMIAAGEENDLQKRIAFLKAQGGHFFSDTSDTSCQLYYQLKDATILRAEILIGSNTSKLKQKFCLLQQINSALGIGNPSEVGFAELWATGPSAFRNLGEEQFAEARNSFAILRYLHMCSALKSEMSLSAVLAALVDEPICTEKLREEN